MNFRPSSTYAKISFMRSVELSGLDQISDLHGDEGLTPV